MPYDEFASPFVRQALAEVTSWGRPGSGLVVERLGPLMWRVKLGGPEGPQVMFLRPTRTATYLEPYLNDATDNEVAALRSRFSNPADVVFPYLRGGRGRGALLRVRNENDLRVLRDIVARRAASGEAGRSEAKTIWG